MFVYVLGPSCKTRWGNIRETIENLWKKKRVSGQKLKIMKQFKYSQQLSFLIKFFEERETMTNIDDEVTNQDFTDNDGVSYNQYHMKMEKILMVVQQKLFNPMADLRWKREFLPPKNVKWH